MKGVNVNDPVFHEVRTTAGTRTECSDCGRPVQFAYYDTVTGRGRNVPCGHAAGIMAMSMAVQDLQPEATNEP